MADLKKWAQTAPSNIALIKYMGKKESEYNLASNPSISYTLDYLKTKVELEMGDYQEDLWEPLEEQGYYKTLLGPKESQRFLQHLQFLKKRFGVEEYFIVRSASNFPQNCGLASSASSFAALTQAAIQAFCELKNIKEPGLTERAFLSREGSGSSCRSFCGPWCLWDEDKIEKVEFPFRDLIHIAVIADESKKRVSSSEAHKRVQTSLLYEGRTQRASQRLGAFIESLLEHKWGEAFEISWAEFWDMHALFETSEKSFGYMTPETIDILKESKSIWNKISDGPLITMDAGPNVHLLFRKEQRPMAESLKEKFENKNYKVFSNVL